MVINGAADAWPACKAATGDDNGQWARAHIYTMRFVHPFLKRMIIMCTTVAKGWGSGKFPVRTSAQHHSRKP